MKLYNEYYDNYDDYSNNNINYNDTNSYQGIKKPKKKKHTALKVILSLIFIPILLVLITLSVLIGLIYKNVKIPESDLKNTSLEFDPLNSTVLSLDSFLQKKGNQEYCFKADTKTINLLLYHEIYKKRLSGSLNNISNFLTEGENETKNYVHLLGEKDSTFYAGAKGVWVDLKEDNLKIYLGVDLIKPIKFKSGLTINFKINFQDGEQKDNIRLTLNSAYLGNLPISKKVLKKIYTTLDKNHVISSNIKNIIDNGFPSSDPYARVSLNDFSILIDKVKLFNNLKTFLDGKYDKNNETDKIDVNNLFNFVSDEVNKKQFIDFKIEDSKIVLSLQANKLKTNTEPVYKKLDKKYQQRFIDIIKNRRNDILLNFLNTNNPDEFSLTFNREEIDTLIKILLQHNGLTNKPIFNEGLLMKLKNNLIRDEYSNYLIKAGLPNFINLENGEITLESFWEITKLDDKLIPISDSKLISRFEIIIVPHLNYKLYPEVSEFNIEVKKFGFGDNNIVLTEKELKGLFSLNALKFGINKKNSFVFDSIFNKFERQTGFKISRLDTTKKDLIVININITNNKILKDLNSIRMSLINVFESIKSNPDFTQIADIIDTLTQHKALISDLKAELEKADPDEAIIEEIKNKLNAHDNEKLLEKVKALNMLNQKLNDDQLQAFNDEFSFLVNQTIGSEFLESLHIKS